MRLNRLPGTSRNLLGVLSDDDGRIYFTVVEDREKAILEGVYTVKRMRAEDNPKHGVCFEVQRVPNRSDILFHPANDHTDVDGCIGVGFGFGENETGPCVTQSQDAYKRFMRFLARVQSFTLTVRNPR